MGIEYMLIKPDKNEYFDLSKGSWQVLSRVQLHNKPIFILRDLFKNQSELAELIHKKVFEPGSDFGTVNPKFGLTISSKLANHIWDWCGYDRIVLLNDASFTKNLDNLDTILSMYDTRSYSKDHYTLKCTGDRFEIFQDE